MYFLGSTKQPYIDLLTMNVSIDWMFAFVDDATSTAGEQLVYEVVVVGEPKPKVTWLYNHKHISVSHF